jgi:hypothetical protein
MSQAKQMIYDQSEFDLRCEWGAQGISELAKKRKICQKIARSTLHT